MSFWIMSSLSIQPSILEQEIRERSQKSRLHQVVCIFYFHLICYIYMREFACMGSFMRSVQATFCVNKTHKV